jgi:hypothetical protein
MPRPLRTETLTDELPALVSFMESVGMTARPSLEDFPTARTTAPKEFLTMAVESGDYCYYYVARNRERSPGNS